MDYLKSFVFRIINFLIDIVLFALLVLGFNHYIASISPILIILIIGIGGIVDLLDSKFLKYGEQDADAVQDFLSNDAYIKAQIAQFPKSTL